MSKRATSIDLPRIQRPLSPLLRLPLELRQQIYTHLIPLQPTSHPLPTVGLTSVSHKPPASAILNVHPQLTDELLDYFFNITTWKLIFSHAFNFFRVDPHLSNLEKSYALHRIRKIEIVVYCDVLLLKGWPDFGLDRFCAEIEKKVRRAVDVLSQAEELRTAVVSWIDTTGTGGWETKAQILSPLLRLRPQVSFKVGTVNGVLDQVDQVAFAKAMEDVLGVQSAKSRHERSVGPSLDGSKDDEPASLRMLAFDVKQDRQLYDTANARRFVEVALSNALAGNVG